jgi:quercetin dioxygenase-like cupin family protein
MDVVRFGVGHRRSEGPPGTTGLSGAVIHTDGRGLVAELAFGRNARLEPHSNPNTTWFVAIEGGGWVGVGDERARVSAGEAVLWPADVIHTAWTEHSEMRAIVVEFSGADDHVDVLTAGGSDEGSSPAPRRTVELQATEPPPADPRPPEPRLTEPPTMEPRPTEPRPGEPRTFVGKGVGGLAAHERRRDDTTREGEPF